MRPFHAFLLATMVASAPLGAQDPARAARELLDADRAFAAAGARTDLVSALTGMFAPDVVLLVGADIVHGADSAGVALRRNADNARSRVEWTPIRAGISADGADGFTYGYMTLVKPDSARVPLKYVAYWRRGADGWRVLVYKRSVRAAGEVSLAEREPALPPRGRARTPAAESGWRDELIANEAEFSRDAQSGFVRAFRVRAASDAAHAGGPNDASFRFGPDAIAEGVGAGGPLPANVTVTWGADEAYAATSGDLGITIGRITQRVVPADGSPAKTTHRPFFTIWQRPEPGAPWRYVIE